MNGLPSGQENYDSAAMTDSLTIWICGAGSVYLSTDLGLTWTEANRPGDSLGLPVAGGDIAAWDNLNAVIATAADGRIYRTSDGGETWHKVFEDPNVTTWINTMEMVSDSVGFAIGDAPNASSPPAIVRTTDAGWTWVPLAHNLPLGYYQWYGPTTDFISAEVGWSHQHMPNQPTILLFRTTDGGVTWEELSDIYCYGLCFIDDSIGVRCPQASLHTLRTTDGGLTWEPTAGENGIWLVASPDGDRLWCLGGQSLQASDDSVATWYEQTLPFRPLDFPPGNGSFFNKDIGVLVGRKVLVTTTGGNAVVDVESDNSVPTMCSVAQNYPNPFNPTTTIEYTLPHAGFVTLKVYNVLGEEVATLVDGDHAAGTFTATWDASGMPSGIYFYRLSAGEYVQTKKAVLMR